MSKKAANGLRVVNETGGVLDIYIYAVIGDLWFDGVSAKDVVDALDSNADAKTVNVYINSPGGNVFDADAIYNALHRRSETSTINVHIDGIAGSAASYVAMAGDTIAMAENATFFIHDPSTCVCGKATDLRKGADMLDKIRDSIAGIYTARTGLSEDEVKAMMADDTYLTAEEANEKGFVDSITENKKAAAFCGRLPTDNQPDWLKARIAAMTPVEPNATGDDVMSQKKQTEETKTEKTTPEIDVNALKSEGANSELERFTALSNAFDDAAFVADQFKAGKTVEEAQAAWSELRIANLTAERDKQAERIAELEKNLAEKAPTNGVTPVSGTPGGTGGAETFESVAKAKAEELGIPFAKACSLVCNERPDLYEVYNRNRYTRKED